MMPVVKAVCLARRLFLSVGLFAIAYGLAAAQSQPPGASSAGRPVDAITAVAFSPDGKTLAISRRIQEASRWSGRIELWDVNSGQTRRVIRGFDGSVWSLSFSADGHALVSGSSEFRETRIQGGKRIGRGFVDLKWWDAGTGELNHEVPLPEEDRRALMIAHSPDGRTLASVEYYNDLTAALARRDAGVGGLRRTGDPGNPGPRVGLAALNGEVKVLDAQTGALRLKFKTRLKYSERFGSWNRLDPRAQNIGWHSALFKPIIFSPDGRYLAAGTLAEIKIWDSQTGEESHTLGKFAGDLNAYCFSPDSRQLATVSTLYDQRREGDNLIFVPKSEIRIYDIQSGKVIRNLTGQGDVLASVVFAPDGKTLLAGSSQYEEGGALGNLKIWDLQSGKLLRYLTGGEQPVMSVVFSPRGDLLALESGGDGVKVLDTRTWKVKQTLLEDKDHDKDERADSRFVMSLSKMQAVSFLADGHSLAGASDADGVKVWDSRTGEIKQRVTPRDGADSRTLLAGDGKTLVTVRDDRGVVRRWDMATGKQESTFEIGTSLNAAGNDGTSGPLSATVTGAALTGDGRMLALARGREITLWDVQAGKVHLSLSAHSGNVNCLTFSQEFSGAGGRILASVSDDGTIELWDVASGKLQRSMSTGAKVTALGLSPNGQMLASAGADRIISLWDLVSGTVKQRLKKHEDAVRALAFSPNGQMLASGGDDRVAIIWEAGSGKVLRTLKGHELAVTALAFSADGRLVASGAGNSTVVIWDAESGKLNRILR